MIEIYYIYASRPDVPANELRADGYQVAVHRAIVAPRTITVEGIQ